MDEYDEAEHAKEVFACFGLAYHNASCLEAGLAMAMLYVDFLAKVTGDSKRTAGRGFNRARYDSEFDAFLHNQHAQVMGTLVKRVNAATNLSDDLKAKIAEANKSRNFLSHHFWRERAVEFVSAKGRDQLIAELETMGEFFNEVDHQLDAEMLPARQALGMNDEAIERRMAGLIAAFEGRA